MLKLGTACNQTPFVHLFLDLVVSSIGKVVSNRWLSKVLFPEDWVPKIDIVSVAVGNCLSYRLIEI